MNEVPMSNMNQESISNSDSENTRSREVATVLKLVDFLATQPTMSEFAQFMVMDVFAKFRPWGACIAMCDDRAHMRVTGVFGLSEGLVNLYEHGTCFGMPMAGGIFIDGDPVGSMDTESMEREESGFFSVLNQQGPNALGLMSARSLLIGMVQVLFLHPIDSEESAELASEMEQVVKIMSFVLSQKREMGLVRNIEFAGPDGAHPPLTEHVEPRPIELTARQLEILKYMADGKTNAAISRLIGFSESTVRQETIEIYRQLNAHDRRLAVSKARSLGLLTAPSGVRVSV